MQNSNTIVLTSDMCNVLPDGTLILKDLILEKCNVIVPEKINNIIITKLADSCFNNCYIESVELPDTIVSLGDANTFSNCPNLLNVKLPRSITCIPSGAFMNCNKLKEIHVPESVTEIFDVAFAHCEHLESITGMKKVFHIGRGVFENCIRLSAIETTKALRNIEYHAFDNTCWLKNKQEKSPYVILNKTLIDASKATGNICIPNNVEYIAEGAFENNSKALSISIPFGVKNINAFTFGNCKSLKNITLPSSIRYISYEGFNGTNNLNINFLGLDEELKSVMTSTLGDNFSKNNITIIATQDIDIFLHNIINGKSDAKYDNIIFTDKNKYQYAIDKVDTLINDTLDLNKKLNLLTVRDCIEKRNTKLLKNDDLEI